MLFVCLISLGAEISQTLANRRVISGTANEVWGRADEPGAPHWLPESTVTRWKRYTSSNDLFCRSKWLRFFYSSALQSCTFFLQRVNSGYVNPEAQGETSGCAFGRCASPFQGRFTRSYVHFGESFLPSSSMGWLTSCRYSLIRFTDNINFSQWQFIIYFFYLFIYLLTYLLSCLATQPTETWTSFQVWNKPIQAPLLHRVR